MLCRWRGGCAGLLHRHGHLPHAGAGCRGARKGRQHGGVRAILPGKPAVPLPRAPVLHASLIPSRSRIATVWTLTCHAASLAAISAVSKGRDGTWRARAGRQFWTGLPLQSLHRLLLVLGRMLDQTSGTHSVPLRASCAEVWAASAAFVAARPTAAMPSSGATALAIDWTHVMTRTNRSVRHLVCGGV